MKIALLSALVAASAFAAPAEAAGWDVTPYFGVPGAFSVALSAVNDSGVLVGHTFTSDFVDDHGHLTFYPNTYPDANIAVRDISDSGVLAGNDLHGGFIADHGTTTGITLPNGRQAIARSISADGRYVSGMYHLSDTSMGFGGFILDRTTSQVTLVLAPAGSTFELFQGINDSGIATGILNGERGFVYDLASGTSTIVGDRDGLSHLQFLTINNAGEIGGVAADSAGRPVGFIGSVAHGFTRFEDPSLAPYLIVTDLNDRGEAVGVIGTFSGGAQSFTATLTTSVPDPDPVPTPDPVPVPEPASSTLWFGGLLAAGLAVARRRHAKH